MPRTTEQTWREFEKLVARIEEAAAGSDVTVVSPDRVRSLITGRMREVDATVRARIGTADVLITIECRRRKATQDVTWLEQLWSKKQAIGASRTLAVASSSFSEDAIKAAAYYGIELRVISEITGADVCGLLRLPRSVVHVFKCVDLYEQPTLEFRVEPGDDFSGPDGFGPESDLNARVFVTGAGEAISFNDLWLRADDQMKIFDSIPADDKAHRCAVEIKAVDELFIETRRGPRRVLRIKMPMLLRWKHEVIPLEAAKVVAYETVGSSDEAQRQIRGEFESNEAHTNNVRVGVQFSEKSSEVIFTMQLLPAPKE